MPVRHNESLTKSHYEGHSADTYESAYFYEVGPYTEHLKKLVQERLQLTKVTKPKVLLDIGGGTGNFTKMIVNKTPIHPVVVDPFLESSSSIGEGEEKISFIKAAAEAFMQEPGVGDDWRKDFDFVLLKEVAHHFDDSDRVSIFRGMYNGIVPSGENPSLLIITRPKRDIDYPLWDEAREVWANNQPSAEDFISELKQAGFSNIDYSIESYPCSIKLERWQSMVKNRFWSTFSNFSDEELETACQTIAEAEKHRTVDGSINFDDRLVFIAANKV